MKPETMPPSADEVRSAIETATRFVDEIARLVAG